LHGKGYKVNTIGVVEFILAAHLSKVRDLGFGKARIANPRQRGVYVLRISNGNNLYIKRFARF
jgi:hypothetical protein